MRPPRGARPALVGGSGLAILTATGAAAASPTDLAQTMPLVWVILAISVAGAFLTYAILAYALWRFRDPATRGRRYG